MELLGIGSREIGSESAGEYQSPCRLICVGQVFIVTRNSRMLEFTKAASLEQSPFQTNARGEVLRSSLLRRPAPVNSRQTNNLVRGGTKSVNEMRTLSSSQGAINVNRICFHAAETGIFFCVWWSHGSWFCMQFTVMLTRDQTWPKTSGCICLSRLASRSGKTANATGCPRR